MSSTLIVISRGRRSDPEHRESEDRLIREMADQGYHVLVIPHLYDLPEDHSALKRLGNEAGKIALFSWLAPRAAEWVLRRMLGCLSSHHAPRLRCFGMETDPDSAAALGFQGAEGRVDDLSEDLAPRWYPVLDYSRCTGCAQCEEFCLFGVYTQEDDTILATNPDLCKTGCPACARVCPAQAIMFPHYEPDALISGKADPDASAPAARAVQDAQAERRQCSRDAPDDDLEGLVDELSDLDI